MQQFLGGSQAFFSKYEDFKPHDTDYIVIGDPLVFGPYWRTIKKKTDIFRYNISKVEDFIEFYLKHKEWYPPKIITLLIPEIQEYLGVTIEHLKQLAPIAELIEGKHLYIKYLYDWVIANNTLKYTDEVIDEAYKIYKDARPQTYETNS